MRYKKFTFIKDKIYLLSFMKSCENSAFFFSQITSFFEINGYFITPNIIDSSIVVINGCAVTDSIIKKWEREIGRLSRLYPEKTIIIFGCLASLTKRFRNSNQIIMIKASDINKFLELFEFTTPISSCLMSNLSGLLNNYVSCIPNIIKKDNYIQISQGCSNNCSYCNIKLIKGEVKSKSISSIKNEAINLIKAGKHEISLLSDDCGSYGHDINTNIAELISELLDLDKKLKIKIYTIFPGLFLRYYSQLRQPLLNGRITFVGLPLQSGSSRVLKLMNRDYDLNEIKKNIKEIKSVNSDIYLVTHFIINFPTETIQDFRESLKLAKIFDFCLFLSYGENIRRPSSKIIPKCTQQELDTKIRLLNQFIKHKIIKGRILFTTYPLIK